MAWAESEMHSCILRTKSLIEVGSNLLRYDRFNDSPRAPEKQLQFSPALTTAMLYTGFSKLPSLPGPQKRQIRWTCIVEAHKRRSTESDEEDIYSIYGGKCPLFEADSYHCVGEQKLPPNGYQLPSITSRGSEPRRSSLGSRSCFSHSCIGHSMFETVCAHQACRYRGMG